MLAVLANALSVAFALVVLGAGLAALLVGSVAPVARASFDWLSCQSTSRLRLSS